MKYSDEIEIMRIYQGLGPCAKQTVKCTIITKNGERITGENWCLNPQPVCPRNPGEGYEKCGAICQQMGHAEMEALKMAEGRGVGGTAVLEGHTYMCMECQHALYEAGIKYLTRDDV